MRLADLMKLPALQFYVGDWRKDPGVQALGYFDRGVWFEMLCLMHESSERGKLLLNGKKMSDQALAQILGLDNQTLNQSLTTIADFGVSDVDPETQAICCRRMVRDEKLRQIRTEAGKKGGNPALVKQKPTTGDKQKRTPRVNQKSTPSSSSSSSSSISVSSSEEETRATRNPTVEEPRLEGVLTSAEMANGKSKHPAIVMCMRVLQHYPDKTFWSDIIEALGDQPDLAKLDTCHKEWVARKKPGTNLEWVKWYKDGIPQTTTKQKWGNGYNGSNQEHRNGPEPQGKIAKTLASYDYSVFAKPEPGEEDR